jgi:hypothetical protein
MRAFDRIFLMLVLAVLQVPQLFYHYGHAGSVKGLVLMLVIGLMLLRLMIVGLGVGKQVTKYRFMLVAYLSVIFIAICRGLFGGGEYNDSVALLAYFGAVILVCTNYFILNRQPLSFRERLDSFCLGIVLYIAINFLLYFFDLKSGYAVDEAAQAGQNITMQVIGLDMKRALFPMAYGVNAYGNIVGAAIIISAYLIRSSSGSAVKLAMWMFLAISVMSLVMLESRGAYIAVAFALLFSAKLKRASAKIFVLTAPLIPFFLFLISAVLVSTGIMDLVSRGSFDFGGLVTDRDVIWGAAISELSSVNLMHIIGYGLYGNDISGVMDKYSWIFAYSDSAFRTLHNGALQNVFDVGYLGLFFYFSLQFSYFERLDSLESFSKNLSWLLRALMAYILFLSGTEAIPTIYFPEGYYVFMVILFAVYQGNRVERRA